MKKYVLTGGPGSGKSSIILALERRKETVVREAAEDHINLRRALGDPEPWRDPLFQWHSLTLQMQRETAINEYATRVFIDRGLPDGLAYCSETDQVHSWIKRAADTSHYDQVFLIEPLDDVRRTAVRREDRTAAMEIHKRLAQVYTDFGYTPIRIPAGPLEGRVAKILDAASDGSND